MKLQIRGIITEITRKDDKVCSFILTASDGKQVLCIITKKKFELIDDITLDKEVIVIGELSLHRWTSKAGYEIVRNEFYVTDITE